MSMALDVPRLIKRIISMEDAPADSAEWRRVIAAEFAKRGEPVTPVGVERWRQRGSLPTSRLLMLLKIANDRRVPINLLDFVTSGELFVAYKSQDRIFKDRKKREFERLKRIAERTRVSA